LFALRSPGGALREVEEPYFRKKARFGLTRKIASFLGDRVFLGFLSPYKKSKTIELIL
jgi:hypothetical protein